MLNWKKILIALISLLISQSTFACNLCAGNGYVGAYSTGGYNLYTFTTDIYAIIDTPYYSMPNYGGGCGTLLGSCNSCYNSPVLYGNSGYDPNTQLINQLLISQINQNTMQMCMASGMCDPVNPYLPGSGPIPPLMPPMSPPPGVSPIPYYPPVVPPNFPYGPNAPYPPINPYTPPTTQLPYGGCDNVIVMCPSGPVTPGGGTPYIPINNPITSQPPTPPSTPIVPTIPITVTVPSGGSNSPTNPTPYNYPATTQPGTQNLPQSPIRYNTPRGASNRTH
jgi:hypothetical protein